MRCSFSYSATVNLVHDYNLDPSSSRLLFAFALAPLDVTGDGDTDLSMAKPL